jgi:Zn-dependent protease
MTGWWVHDLYQQGAYVTLISWVFWVIFSITLHELAHGWAALWQGDNTPRAMGHMTANPIVHMGPMSLLMFAVIGIAWGMMPVDPSRFRWKRRGRIVVSGAGPAMNIALALVALTLAALWTRYGPINSDPLFGNVQTFLITGGWINVFLAVFNMLPVPPLDGASVLAGFSLRFYQLMNNPQAMMISMFILMAIFLSGVGGLLFEVARRASAAYVGAVEAVLP